MIALAVSGLVGLGAVIAVLVLATGGGNGGSGAQDVAAAMRAAGCTFRSVEPQAFRPNHADVPTLSSPVRWSTDPPAAGAHYGETAIWGFYRTPLNPRNVVHNEEHGGVVLWFGPRTPAATVDELERFYAEDPNAMLGTVYPKLGRKVAITAWTIDNPRNYFQDGNLGVGRVAVCPTFNANAFTSFRDAFRGKGPEAIPPRLNRPGGN